MKDLRQSQLSQMHREKRALIASGVDRDKFINQCRAKAYPEGSTHAFALDQVYGPIGSKENKNVDNGINRGSTAQVGSVSQGQAHESAPQRETRGYRQVAG